MSKIDELILEYCPDGVIYFEISEVCETISTGKQRNRDTLSKLRTSQMQYPVINGGISPSGFTDESNTKAETITVSQGGASAGFVSYMQEPFWSGAHCYTVVPKDINIVLNMFLYFFLKDSEKILMDRAMGAGIPGLNRKALNSLKIPIPPIEVQKEIVDILDKFTQLEAELEAELEARQKQYEYYRSQLFTFNESNESVKWLTLDEVCKSIGAGGDLPKNFKKGQQLPTNELPYPIFSNGSDGKALYGFTDSYKIDEEAVSISARGTIGFHAIRPPKFTPIVRLLTLIPDNTIITTKYLNYALDITEIGHSGGSIPQLTVPNVKKIKIPVPSISEQDRITDIMDIFNALAGSIYGELPAEINARRQQYEYYRTRLLTFQELPS